MYNKLTWDDIRLIHEISSSGTLSGAARALRVTHPTVFRRLNAIEEKLGVRFFQRSRTGYAQTRAAEEICSLYERLHDAVDVAERRITGQDLRPSGVVRVTTTDSLLFGWLSSALAGFRLEYPEIRLAVVVSNDFLNLSRREADIAVRPSISPPNAMSIKKIGAIEQGIYISRKLLSHRPAREALSMHPWIGPDDSIHYPALQNWMKENDCFARCQYRSNSVLDMFVATKHGLGISILPNYLATSCDELVKCGGDLPDMTTDLWLVTHPDLRRTERIKLLVEWIDRASRDVFG
ncbi:MAG: LysR family transcriptional regulator [Pseudomonadota bacterium]